MNYTFSKKEEELMEIFWDAGEPLSREEILKRAAARQCSWKPNSLHILVNSLLDKKAVQVEGYYLSSRKLGRAFGAAITRREYSLMQIRMGLEEGERLAGLEPRESLRILTEEYQNPVNSSGKP